MRRTGEQQVAQRFEETAGVVAGQVLVGAHALRGGAFVTPDTLARAAAQGLSPDEHLARNDACSFFEPLGDLLFTGPTHTNVNDFRAVWVGSGPA